MNSFEKKRRDAPYVHTNYHQHRENYSVENPDPDVFWPPGSGFFHQQAKKSRQNLDFYYFVTSF